MIIYKITNKLNGKMYIGQTTGNLKYRWNRHCSSNSKCVALNAAIQKYGSENFKVEIIMHCDTIVELNEKESFFIKHFNTLSPHGYNLTVDCSNRIFSEETKQRMRDNHFLKKEGSVHPFKGKNHTDYTKRRISEKLKGNEAYNKGLPLSEETKEKISISLKGRSVWNTGKCKYRVIGPGIEFNSIQEAALYYGVTNQAIHMRCKRRPDWKLI